MDERELSIFKRLFVLQFVNTTVATVLGSSSFERLFGASSKGVKDFNWQWYRDVGSDILVIMLLQ